MLSKRPGLKRKQPVSPESVYPIENKSLGLSFWDNQTERRVTVPTPATPSPSVSKPPALLIQEQKQEAATQALLGWMRAQSRNVEFCVALFQSSHSKNQEIYQLIECQQRTNPSLIQRARILAHLYQLIYDNWEKGRQTMREIDKANTAMAIAIVQNFQNEISVELKLIIFRFYQKLMNYNEKAEQWQAARDQLCEKISKVFVTEMDVLLNSIITQNDSQTQQRAPNWPMPPEQKPIPKLLTDNLSMSLFKGMLTASSNLGDRLASSIVLDQAQTIRNQGVLLQQINKFLFSQGEPLISEQGHCHGISLCWLRMKQWGLGAAHKKIRDTITKTPDDQLHKIGPLIRFYLKLIDLGQNPGKYSNGTCGQLDILEIMGCVDESFSIKEDHDKESLIEALKAKLGSREASMFTISSSGILHDTQIQSGHTLAVYYENNQFTLFDSNDPDGSEIILPNLEKLVDACWYWVFDNNKIDGGPKPYFEILALTTPEIPKVVKDLAGYFNKEDNLVKAILNRPVKENQTVEGIDKQSMPIPLANSFSRPC